MVTTANSVEVHPVADALPMIKGAAWDEFVEDIRANGLKNPIDLLPDGRVIDGRNRLKACRQLGIEPIYRTVTEDPTTYVMTMNIHRRNLDASRKSALAVSIMAHTEAAKAAKRKALGSSRGGSAKVLPILGEPSKRLDKSEKPPTADRAMAASVGVSHQYIATAKKLKNENPEAFEKLLDGEIKMADATFLLKKSANKKGEQSANEDMRKAKDWVGRIEGVADYCRKVTAGAIRSDERLRQHWLEAIKNAKSALTALKKRIEE